MSNTLHQSLLAWLPPELRDAPGIDWSLLSDAMMKYCVQSIGESPDALPLAVAIASAIGQVSAASLLQMTRHLHTFLCTMRSACAMQSVSDLREEAIWNDFEASTQMSLSRSRQLSCYSSVSTKHYPPFRAKLLEAGSPLAHLDLFPRMPHGFLKRVGNAYTLNTASQDRQRPTRETLVPLFPLLRQLIWERKQVAERMLNAFRQALHSASGIARLPLSYEYIDSFPFLTQQGEEWLIRRRNLPLRFTLWTRTSWVLHHRDRYDEAEIRDAEGELGVYSSVSGRFFVQFLGDAEELFWFGDLVAHQLLHHLEYKNLHDPVSRARLQLARQLGFSHGCATSQSELLHTRGRWFAQHAREGDLLFDPESLHRGVLYGAALALLALTNGGSLGELLQVSFDCDIDAGERYQFLLPDGAKPSDERRPFLITAEAAQLLQEIARGLMESYNEVPLITPSRQITKFDRLQEERYLFQWQMSMLGKNDVQILVRFLLYGVPLMTTEGIPLRLTLDLLRDGRTSSDEAAFTKERSRVLLGIFGFTQDAVTGLSSASRDAYCRDFLAFYLFAGSKEAALQPEMLHCWRDHLQREEHYKTGTVNRMVDEVRSILCAAAERGYVERGVIGEKNLLHERSQVLLNAFGFTHDVVTGLSPVARKIYCNDFLAYSRFAGSKEAALQRETLQRWRDHLLREEHYKAGTVNRMIRTVESILRSAAAQGYIDPVTTTALGDI